MREYDELIIALSRDVVGRIDGWELLPDEGQEAVMFAARKLVQYTLDEARGVDRRLARAALIGVMLNWKTVGWIRAAGLGSDVWDVLVDGLVEGGVIMLRILARGVVS